MCAAAEGGTRPLPQQTLPRQGILCKGGGAIEGADGCCTPRGNARCTRKLLILLTSPQLNPQRYSLAYPLALAMGRPLNRGLAKPVPAKAGLGYCAAHSTRTWNTSANPYGPKNADRIRTSDVDGPLDRNGSLNLGLDVKDWLIMFQGNAAMPLPGLIPTMKHAIRSTKRDLLSDAQIRTAKPKPKDWRLTDGAGLTLLVKVDGAKHWRFRFVDPASGAEHMLSLGSYPDVSLAMARETRDAYRAMLAKGLHPGREREKERTAAVSAGKTFQNVAADWLTSHGKKTMSAKRFAEVCASLKRHVFPGIGALPLCEVRAPVIMSTVIEPLQAKGFGATAHAALGTIGQVLRYAVAYGLSGAKDVTTGMWEALAPHATKHHAALIEPMAIGRLLADIHGYTDGANPRVRDALLWLAHTAMRPSEVCAMEWSWIDQGNALVNLPADADKVRLGRAIPISPTMGELLAGLPRTSAYVFPGRYTPRAPDALLARSTLEYTLRVPLGYGGKHSPHGFRATYRTLGDELFGWDYRMLEIGIGHKVLDPLGRAYGRMEWIAQRRQMAENWSLALEKWRLAIDP